jgi:UDP-glucose 4-epimerase
MLTRVPAGVSRVVSRVSDSNSVRSIIANEGIVGVIHLAGSKQARESIREPVKYWRNNVTEMTELLAAIRESTVDRFVFSSSSSIYGSQPGVTEESLPQPNSPYAHTKLSCELLLRDYAQSTALRFVSLRYFNVIGCAPDAGLADTGADNVVPRFLDAVEQRLPLPVYGRTHATPDGTCLRDYVDVRDLARAHALAVLQLNRHAPLPPIVNLSSGRPTSVLEIAHEVNRAFDRDVGDVIELAPQPGDPAEVWGRPSLAGSVLGWVPSIGLTDSIRDHITAMRAPS